MVRSRDAAEKGSLPVSLLLNDGPEDTALAEAECRSWRMSLAEKTPLATESGLDTSASHNVGCGSHT